MEKVNNKNGIEMYYQIEEDYPRFVIYDSNQRYFNDLILEKTDFETDFKMLKEKLEQTDLNSMCAMFGAKIYNTLHKLAKEQEIDDNEIDPLQNENVNVFRIKDKVFYTWYWG